MLIKLAGTSSRFQDGKPPLGSANLFASKGYVEKPAGTNSRFQNDNKLLENANSFASKNYI
jgi:hypothetical protein